jgi:hypothetical protein
MLLCKIASVPVHHRSAQKQHSNESFQVQKVLSSPSHGQSTHVFSIAVSILHLICLYTSVQITCS